MYKRDLTPRYVNISDKDFNKHLEWCKENRPICVNAKYEEIKNTYEDKYEFNRRYPSGMCYYLKTTVSKMYLTYKKGDKWYNYDYNAANPEGGELKPTYTGGDAYRHLQQYAHIPDLKGKYGYTLYHRSGKSDGIMWNIKNLMPAPYVNRHYMYNKDTYVYVYDMHRAFLKACFGLYPDTTVEPKTMSKVGKNEVGFDENGIPILEDDGHSHLYVFPLVKNPGIEKWAKYMNKKILDLKDKQGKEQELYDAKHEYTDAIGMICRHNPFFHNMISGRCISYMEKLIDENTIRSVTDSIVSLVARDDLELGEDMGQFNLEFEGYYYATDSGYDISDKDGNILRYKHRGPRPSDKLSYLGESYWDGVLNGEYLRCPFYFEESKCLSGDFPIMDYFRIDQQFDKDLYNAHIARLTPFYQRRNIINQEKQQILLKAQNDALFELYEEIDKLEYYKKEYLHEKKQKESPEYYEYNPDREYIEQVINHCNEEIAKIDKQIIELKEIITNEEIRIAKKEQIRK